jgi:hypothetical protein
MCSRGKNGACKFARDAHRVDMQVAEWVEADDMGEEAKVPENEEAAKEDNTDASMKRWPTMVDDLIDL